ncbi:hypothetical protein BUALT_Bualt12G0093500 [Buddleja alternifolia]|uniref:SWIM-type domain-containing protein n=1 Tax=Buddleja alternifolia TaxID=168488 RepID=A0AAV6WWL4_9LAMI|nr:hypothetical protein BUALT_Bualt12G0093500 [Buddleja alternifolia]
MSLRNPKLNDYEHPNYHDLEPAVTLSVSIPYIDKLCELLGYMGRKREVHVYLEATMDLSSQVGSSNVNEVHEPNDLGDLGVEWAGGGGVNDTEIEDALEEMSLISDSNSSDFNSDKDSDHENGPKVPVFSLVDSEEPKFELGLNVKGFKDDVIQKIRVHVSRNQAYRAKWNALKSIEGNSIDQHSKLWDYAEELRRSNPGSTIVLTVSQGVNGENIFGRFYGDLNISPEQEPNYTFMSDKQKGLVPALESVFPGSTKRFCVRHLFENMQIAGFKGTTYKKAVRKVAMATTVAEFDERYKQICKINLEAGEWLNDKHPSEWSKSHFNVHPKCDILLNNFRQSFNSKILYAREKQIYTMLELIRVFLMTRMQTNRDVAFGRCKNRKLSPNIQKILQKNHDRAASDSNPIKSTEIYYEISCFDGTRCVVDLERHSCSCRKWDLSGILCKHAMSAINSQRLNGEDFVDDYYTVQTYLRVYDNYVYPVNGPEKWNKTNLSSPLPPNNPRGVGSPPEAKKLGIGEAPKKRRNRTRGKDKPNKLKKIMGTYKCSNCKEPGHNKKHCQIRENADEAVEMEAARAEFDASQHQENADVPFDNEFGLSPEEEAEMEAAVQAVEMEIASLASDSFPVDHGVEEQLSVDLSNNETKNIDSQATARKRTQQSNSQVMIEKSSAQVWMALDETRNKTKGKGIALQDTEKVKFSSRRCCSNSTRKGPVFKALRAVSSEALTAPSRQPSASLAQTRKSATRAHAGAPKPSPRPPRPQSQPSALKAATTSAKSTSAPIAPRGATRTATPRSDSPESAATSTGLKIRHVPLSPDHTRTFISMTMRKRKPLGDYTNFIVREGKKYVTMKNLNDALNVKKAEFEASQGKK